MHYNSTLDEVQNADGVEIDVLDFSSPSTIDYLTPFYEPGINYFSYYFHDIINNLKKYHCFKEGEDLLAAAYDFRSITRIFEFNYITLF